MLARIQVFLATACLTICAGGCSLFPSHDQSENAGLLPMVGASDHFQAVAKAKENNAVVLHVVGAKEPSRVIPLPEDGSTVYVSMLLSHSGVTKDFGLVDATLHREGTDIMSGVRMAVRFLPRSKVVVPECDYALRAGDRLEVQERKVSPLDAISSMFSPGERRRAVLVQ